MPSGDRNKGYWKTAGAEYDRIHRLPGEQRSTLYADYVRIEKRLRDLAATSHLANVALVGRTANDNISFDNNEGDESIVEDGY